MSLSLSFRPEVKPTILFNQILTLFSNKLNAFVRLLISFHPGTQKEKSYLHSVLPLDPRRDVESPCERTSHAAKDVLWLDPLARLNGSRNTQQKSRLNTRVSTAMFATIEVSLVSGQLVHFGALIVNTYHAARHIMERMARVPDGALDMIGPSTFDGGYSPSHVMSSAKS